MEFWVDAVIDVIIVIDIILNFFRFSYDKSRRLITDKKAIRTGYLKSWFFVDVMSVFPFSFAVSIIIEKSPAVESTKLLRLSRISRFARLAKLTKLTRLNDCTQALRQFLHNLGISALTVTTRTFQLSNSNLAAMNWFHSLPS